LRTKGFFGWFNRRFEHDTERYMSLLPSMVRHIGRTALFVGVVMLAVVFIWRGLPEGFLPDEDQGYLMVMVNTPEASSLQTTTAAMHHIDEVIRSRSEVLSTAFAAGFNLLAGVAATDSGVIFVSLTPFGKRSTSAMELAEELTKTLYLAIPEAVCYAFVPPSIPGLGITSGVTVEVQDLEGQGSAYLAQEGHRLMEALDKDPLVGSVSTQFNDGVPQRRLHIKTEQALAMGVDMGTLYSTLGTLLGGRYIDNFTRFGRLYQTYLQAGADYRQNKEALEGYFVTSSSGERVPVATLVEVVDTVGVEYISQFNLNRSMTLTITPARGASSGDVMSRVMTLGDELLPDDIGLAWSGVSFQEAQESQKGAGIYLIVLLFVFLALASLYESWGLPIAILAGVPIAVLGAVLFIGIAHLVNPIFINDLYLQISLVMLVGLSAKNAILVVEYANRLLYERGANLLDATLEAARLRLRPILMTAFSFILGVVPLVFASGVYSTARNIMGLALVGGMLLATIIGIFLYPALYYLIARLGRFEERRAKQHA
ncbi:MAG: efflux RND transporter permease subunit, partial [Alistipes sp.]|nr:efflux RND transporter permease subunit [Alistipes sp.]